MNSLGDDTVVACLAPLSAAELCAVAATSRRFRRVASADSLWQALLVTHFGLPPRLCAASAARAGSYKLLYADEAAASKRHQPWRVPGRFTLDAFVHQSLKNAEAGSDSVMPPTPGSGTVAPLAIIFAVDGRRVFAGRGAPMRSWVADDARQCTGRPNSGSVSDEDFRACREMIMQFASQVPTSSLVRAGRAACSLFVVACMARTTQGGTTHARCFSPQVGLLQFAGHVRVEVPFFAGAVAPDDEDEAGDVTASFNLRAFSQTVRAMTRLRGNTCISAALRCVVRSQ